MNQTILQPLKRIGGICRLYSEGRNSKGLFPKQAGGKSQTNKPYPFNDLFNKPNAPLDIKKVSPRYLDFGLEGQAKTTSDKLQSIFARSSPPKVNQKQNQDDLGTLSSLFKTTRPSSFTVHVTANRNNTICTLSDKDGKVLCWASAGSVGLKKANRGTSDAGYQAALSMAQKAELKVNDIKENGVHLKLRGFGPGRDQVFRALLASGWKFTRFTDISGIRFAGCRPKKKRRL
ncbi:hypothetical protein BC833DRAFT_648438 [Globomyces pollinis-pini]|nr:hypothetical protein BC833DRAFT_648438 [Globomyces pollinis-pini]KAJ2994024.1 hypothetical protein HDV02_001911 [Globomyces sp. JEL0801]